MNAVSNIQEERGHVFSEQNTYISKGKKHCKLCWNFFRKSSLNSDTLTSALDSGTVSSDSPAELSSEATLESRVEKIEQWIANVRNQLL